ncbi:hypothetical protein [Streptomyces sp. NBC_01361]|uniref:hypothetical protein n=1 Tax=Streptomyces sp. NBC_01361 TaxID=2903838 RepID=UPI002E3126EB|nr:hypothetical protein [Streptomyces sp. NBC_01361]
MITLHDLYEEGNDRLTEAVQAFGARHPLRPDQPDAEPDWAQAEKHFTRLIEVLMGEAAPSPLDSGWTGLVRRTENEARQLLLTFNTVPGYRCPICVKQRRSLP